ncbi:T9SS type A sorting domain-containing protein [Muricauda brasiliensis]|uniref:T9SS type A sorting domain-containing protein n=1 Tax=Muricauda brasiliensis TaxID=2162892 RepID=UPI00131EF8F7|nr:T9SS type A sorting domain-containing protein [Muricauda brasiliensis]
MKQKLLLFGLLWAFMGTALLAQDEYRVQFSYDSAGNQTLRDWVCINCGTSKEAVVDSTKVEEVALENDILEGILDKKNITGTSTIVAYPNPVTEQLTVEWVDNEKQVAQVILFSGIGQQLFQRTIKSRQGNTNIDFGIYAPGRYILSVYYTDNTNQTFHILKK